MMRVTFGKMLLVGLLMIAAALAPRGFDLVSINLSAAPSIVVAANHAPLGASIAALALTIQQTARETHYTHATVIDAANGIYDVDCSSFTGYLLRQVAPEAYARLPKERGATHPRAFKYQQFFAELDAGSRVPGWSAVPRLVDAQAGDLIAWSRVPRLPGEDTGHVMVVAAVPVVEHNGVVSVRVIDATATPHRDDSRTGGRTGVGTGVIRFEVDADGHPLAYQFTARGRFKPAPISIGRVVESG